MGSRREKIHSRYTALLKRSYRRQADANKPPANEADTNITSYLRRKLTSQISLDVSVLYQPMINELGLLHKTKGENYVNIVLIPQIRAVARSVVGRYTPEQLYSTKRDAIQNEIYEETQKVVENQHIQLNAVLVRDVSLPLAIKEGIERKLIQEQEALEYEFRIEKAKQEAELKAKQEAELKEKQDAAIKEAEEKAEKAAEEKRKAEDDFAACTCKRTRWTDALTDLDKILLGME